MEPQEIEDHVVNIMSGKQIVTLSDGRILVFREPRLFEKKHAHYVYKQSLGIYGKQDLKTSDELIDIAKNNQEWTEVDANYMNKFDEIIDFAKKQKELAITVSQKKRIDKQIDDATKKRKSIAYRYYYVTGHSIEQQAVEDKVRVTIMYVTEHIDGSPLWRTQAEFDSDTDHNLLTELVGLYLSDEFNLNITDIREIARSSSWRIRWSSGKENLSTLFGAEVRDLSDTQFSLVYWSQVYDSVYMSVDCPPDDIIEDDSKLDKWLKDREKEQEQQRRSRAIDKKTGRKGFYDDKTGKFHAHGKSATDHKEIGYMVDGYFDDEGIYRYYTPEEKKEKIAEIHGYNNNEVRRILQSEHEKIKGGEQIREEKLRQGRSRHIMGNS